MNMNALGAFPPKRGPGVREPLRCLQEFADDFGVPLLTLKNLVGTRNSGCPKPIFPGHTSKIGPSRTYYPVKAFRAWWETVKDKA